MSATHRVIVLCPGLLEPLQGIDQSSSEPIDAPFLTKLLNTSTQSTVSEKYWLSQFFSYFGSYLKPNEIPIAALAYYREFGILPKASCYCCDPIYLQVETGQALHDDNHLDITIEEARALTDVFNTHFQAEGLRLDYQNPAKWYLQAKSLPRLDNLPLGVLGGGHIGLFESQTARYWNNILNETQMLFFNHPVNESRAKNNKPLINSVWVYGGGELPKIQRPSNCHIFSDSEIIGDFANYYDIPFESIAIDGKPSFLPSAISSLLVYVISLQGLLQNGSTQQRWLQSVLQLDKGLFNNLYQHLSTGQISKLVIDPMNGHRYSTTKIRKRFFWHKKYPLEKFFTQGC